jgi:hypothetical protein
MQIFLNGIRSYAVTYLRAPNKIFKYHARNGVYEDISLYEVEFIINYIQIEKIKNKHDNFDFNFTDFPGTYLPFDENNPTFAQSRAEFLCLMQDLLFDYGDADYKKRNDMESLRRRWQFFLKLHEKDLNEQYCHFATYEEVYNYMHQRYPFLQDDIIYYIQQENKEEYFQFQYLLYTKFMGAAYGTQDPSEHRCPLNSQHPEREIYQINWVIDYIDAVFSSLLLDHDFLQYYFNPVMNLFIRYFFPVEMEYINDLVKKINIHDKWNSVGTDEKINNMLHVNRTSLQTPIRGLDQKSFKVHMTDVHSYIDKIDFGRGIPINYIVENIDYLDDNRMDNIIYTKENLDLEDAVEITRFTQNTNSSLKFYKNFKDIAVCFKNERTKDYQVNAAIKYLSAYINKKTSKGKNS